MAIPLSSTISWAQPFCGMLSFTRGANNEPALSSANMILSTILGPPFAWRWNRASKTFTVGQPKPQQDTIVKIPDFGWLETASVYVSGDKTYVVEVKDVLGDSDEPGRPQNISAQGDDGSGNITFRLMPVPDEAYSITIVYQKAPTLMTDTTSNWSPIPDYMSFIYNWGFLSLMYHFADSSKSVTARQKFVASLIGASEGLTETEKNVFIQAWLGELQTTGAAQQMLQLGGRARGI